MTSLLLNKNRQEMEGVDAECGPTTIDNKNRRSSILKPNKPRNPFSELDFISGKSEDTGNTQGKTPSRKVRFSSNYVKPFTTENETTVWDNTYEELIEKIEDSAQSDHLNTESIKSTHSILNPNASFLHSIDASETDVDAAFHLNSSSTMNNTMYFDEHCGAEMEFTRTLPTANQMCNSEKENIVSQSHAKDGIKLFETEKRKSRRTIHFANGNDDMEVTSYANLMDIRNSIIPTNENNLLHARDIIGPMEYETEEQISATYEQVQNFNKPILSNKVLRRNEIMLHEANSNKKSILFFYKGKKNETTTTNRTRCETHKMLNKTVYLNPESSDTAFTKPTTNNIVLEKVGPHDKNDIEFNSSIALSGQQCVNSEQENLLTSSIKLKDDTSKKCIGAAVDAGLSKRAEMELILPGTNQTCNSEKENIVSQSHSKDGITLFETEKKKGRRTIHFASENDDMEVTSYVNLMDIKHSIVTTNENNLSHARVITCPTECDTEEKISATYGQVQNYSKPISSNKFLCRSGIMLHEANSNKKSILFSAKRKESETTSTNRTRCETQKVLNKTVYYNPQNYDMEFTKPVNIHKSTITATKETPGDKTIYFCSAHSDEEMEFTKPILKNKIPFKCIENVIFGKESSQDTRSDTEKVNKTVYCNPENDDMLCGTSDSNIVLERVRTHDKNDCEFNSSTALSCQLCINSEEKYLKTALNKLEDDTSKKCIDTAAAADGLHKQLKKYIENATSPLFEQQNLSESDIDRRHVNDDAGTDNLEIAENMQQYTQPVNSSTSTENNQGKLNANEEVLIKIDSSNPSQLIKGIVDLKGIVIADIQCNKGDDGRSENSILIQEAIDKLPPMKKTFNNRQSPYQPLYETLIIDDTQHLINYNLSEKKTKSDFSKIIAGESTASLKLNPKALELGHSSFKIFMDESSMIPTETCKSKEFFNIYVEDGIERLTNDDYQNDEHMDISDIQPTNENDAIQLSVLPSPLIMRYSPISRKTDKLIQIACDNQKLMSSVDLELNQNNKICNLILEPQHIEDNRLQVLDDKIEDIIEISQSTQTLHQINGCELPHVQYSMPLEKHILMKTKGVVNNKLQKDDDNRIDLDRERSGKDDKLQKGDDDKYKMSMSKYSEICLQQTSDSQSLQHSATMVDKINQKNRDGGVVNMEHNELMEISDGQNNEQIEISDIQPTNENDAIKLSVGLLPLITCNSPLSRKTDKCIQIDYDKKKSMSSVDLELNQNNKIRNLILEPQHIENNRLQVLDDQIKDIIEIPQSTQTLHQINACELLHGQYSMPLEKHILMKTKSVVNNKLQKDDDNRIDLDRVRSGNDDKLQKGDDNEYERSLSNYSEIRLHQRSDSQILQHSATMIDKIHSKNREGGIVNMEHNELMEISNGQIDAQMKISDIQTTNENDASKLSVGPLSLIGCNSPISRKTDKRIQIDNDNRKSMSSVDLELNQNNKICNLILEPQHIEDNRLQILDDQIEDIIEISQSTQIWHQINACELLRGQYSMPLENPILIKTKGVYNKLQKDDDNRIDLDRERSGNDDKLQKGDDNEYKRSLSNYSEIHFHQISDSQILQQCATMVDKINQKNREGGVVKIEHNELMEISIIKPSVPITELTSIKRTIPEDELSSNFNNFINISRKVSKNLIQNCSENADFVRNDNILGDSMEHPERLLEDTSFNAENYTNSLYDLAEVADSINTSTPIPLPNYQNMTNKELLHPQITGHLGISSLYVLDITPNIDCSTEKDAKEVTTMLQSDLKKFKFELELLSKIKCVDKRVEQHPSIVEIVEYPFETMTIKNLDEKVMEQAKNCDGAYRIVLIEDNVYTIKALYNTILIIVMVDGNNGFVLNIDVKTIIRGDSEPICIYINHLFVDKMQKKQIKLSVGHKYTILTLLDYIQMNFRSLHKLYEDFDKVAMEYGVQMSKDYKISFPIVDRKLRLSMEILIDFSDIFIINEDSIAVNIKIGTIKEREIKKIVSCCHKGYSFLCSFVEEVFKFLQQKHND